ncbi:MAG: dTDP-4-dehydrorhamnose reductase [Bacteroidetes bacterium]|nr:dTDP-4-dehydrorhamnose reductase [Bacteroidota bacterium]MCY4205420.1 dTDP-4-dehydrorhamnose reductase [Bacteroidota bacterium]
MAKTRLLITGANGLLGQEISRQIVQKRREFDLLVTGRASIPCLRELANHPYASLDICNKDTVQDIFNDFSPEWVINCAAMTRVDDCETHRDDCWRVNAEAVGILAHQCHSHGAHLIQLSTDFIFDGNNGPYREHDRPSPVNFYGKSKLAGENAARGAGVGKWTIVRTNVVYGNACRIPTPDFVHWVLENLSKKQKIQIYTDQWRTPSYTHDLALGILRLIHLQKNGVYNLSGREFLSMYEFSLLIAEAFDLDPTLIHPAVQNSNPQVARRPQYTGLVTLKAETEIGYRPFPLKKALEHLRFYVKIPSTRDLSEDASC